LLRRCCFDNFDGLHKKLLSDEHRLFYCNIRCPRIYLIFCQ
jgi:hypothetical protein